MPRSSDIEVRRAGVDDAAEVARLLHDFNTEFGDPTPGVAILTQRLRRMLEAGEMTVLLGGEPPRGLAVLSCGFTGRERPPHGPRMLFYEREL